ncbi:MAG: type II toxin-antitoxin system HicA family toxin [Lachnospiraceae bacterium]|nr:type II toxin-antitoxin system HicA family toxin [Lachnospiraceae bacterium]
MPMTPKQMIRLLKQNGFIVVSQNGSHVKLKNFINGKQTVVPVHCKDLAKGLENAILKQAGVEK